MDQHSDEPFIATPRPPASEGLLVTPSGRRRGGLRIYVKVDMEGLSGIVSPEQVRPGSPEYAAARHMLMHDLGAVLDGAFAAGCSEAVVYDMHADGRNLDLETLDRRAMLIAGRPLPTNGFYYGLEGSFAALFLVGAHARAGAGHALMPRTYAEDIACVRVNGTEVGEIALEAAIAGKFGVPLAFVSGDSGSVREARELLGDEVEAVEVKQAVTATSAVCLPAARTGKMLHQAAERAVRRAHTVPPLVFQSPTTIEVTLRSPDGAAALAKMPEVERTGERTVRVSGANILAAYKAFVLARAQNGKA